LKQITILKYFAKIGDKFL